MQLEVASGSVTGRDHTRGLRNNQDAWVVQQTRCGTIMVVCDGCSSGAHSEVGAHLGARLICSEILKHLEFGEDLNGTRAERIRENVMEQIGQIVEGMRGSFSQTINDYFLFTALVALIGPYVTQVLGIGDGVYAINGNVTTIGPFENNAPPYLAYGITGSSLANQRPEFLQFREHATIATDELESLLIGTDGVADLMRAEDRALPGRTELVGPLSQFWENDRYFRDNPYLLGRRLNQINPSQPVIRVTEEGGIDRFEGLLPDDTTFVVARRRQGA